MIKDIAIIITTILCVCLVAAYIVLCINAVKRDRKERKNGKKLNVIW